MRKFLTSALAALTLGGAVAATAAPAQARDDYNDGYRHHRGSGDKAAVAAFAGIAGLALGAALSSGNGGGRGYSNGYSSRGGYAYSPRYDSYSGGYSNRGGYDRGGYDRGYYDQGYYAQPDRICISRERVWDPYIERRVTIERRYAC